MTRRAGLAWAAVVLGLLSCASNGRAQTSDDLFDDSTLQRIDLYVNSRDWAQLQAAYQSNTFYTANLKWRGVTVRNVGIRSRGLGSRSQTKPGILVDFEHYTTDQRFLGLKSLVLDNLWQDPSGIHETVAMRFYRRMGLPAPREAHAALYVNNAYVGLYAVVEAIDDVGAARMLGESGGYLFEYKWSREYRFEYLGPELTPYAELFEPRTREHESAFNLYAPIEAMVRAINESADEDFVSKVSEYLDLNELVRRVAVQNVLSQWDGILGYTGTANFYLYRHQGTNLSRLLPWDEDMALMLLEWPVLSHHDEFVLMRRVMADPSLRDLYFETLRAAAASAAEVDGGDGAGVDGGVAPGWLEREVSRQAVMIRELLLADTRKAFANDEVVGAWNAALRFARLRSAFVSCQVRKFTDPRYADDGCTPPPDDGSIVLPASDQRPAKAGPKPIRPPVPGP